MAKIREGILGGLSGKVGTVVGGRWRDVDYIRSKPAYVRNPNTEGQQRQRARFKLMISLMRRLRPFLNEGFSVLAVRQTPMNAAMSVNLKNAISGEFPDFEVSFPDLIVARGDLKKPTGFSAEATTTGSVSINWKDNSGRGSAKDTDQALLLIYNTDSEEAEYDVSNYTRSDAAMEFEVPEEWYGENLECYLAFKSENGEEVSESVYLGSVKVNEPE